LSLKKDEQQRKLEVNLPMHQMQQLLNCIQGITVISACSHKF
jgi:hypothetical protein